LHASQHPVGQDSPIDLKLFVIVFKESSTRLVPERLDFIPAREVLVVEEEADREVAVNDQEVEEAKVARMRRESEKKGEETKKKSKKVPKERGESHEYALVRRESEPRVPSSRGSVEKEVKRSKSNLEQTNLKKPVECTTKQQQLPQLEQLPASPVIRPATISRAQSAYKINPGYDSGRPSPDLTAAGRRPPSVSAPSSVIRSAAARVASTFPRPSPPQPAVEVDAAKVASCTFPRRRPSEFDGRQVAGTQILGRENWPEESSGFIQVADLEVVEDSAKKETMEVVTERNIEEEEEVEDIYQIPKPPVPVVMGKSKFGCNILSLNLKFLKDKIEIMLFFQSTCTRYHDVF